MQPAVPVIELLLSDESATAALAAAFVPHVGTGFVLYLSGDLGSGKTAFTRALLRALGHEGRVRSPTFTLAEPYNLANFELYHFDFYRFGDAREWRDLGFGELLGGSAAAVVEWPELGGDALPPADVVLRLAIPDPAGDDRCRSAALSFSGERGERCVNAIATLARCGRLAGVSLSADRLPPPR